MEERILNLEIKMTTIHNLLMKVANKVQYWEELEETGETEELEVMDTDAEAEEIENHPNKTLQMRQPGQPQQTDPQGTKVQTRTDDGIRARQEKLESNMEEMMEILGKIAGKIDKHNDTPRKPGQERGPINGNQ